MGAALFAALAAAPLAGQTASWGLGLHTGWLNTGSLGEAEPSDMDLKLDDGMALGGGLEWWLGSRRLGVRADVSYTNQPYLLQSGEHEPTWITNNSPGQGTEITGLDQYGNVDTWFGDAALMLRLLKPSIDQRFAPFVSLGAGVVRWDHEDEANGVFINEADTYVQGTAQAEWALAGSLGADFLMTDGLALRFELKDYWNMESPYTFASDADEKQEGAHNQIASIGLQFMFGGARVEEPGFVAAAPQPEPAPAPVVVAAPTTESVQMCVIDQSGRLQLVSATRRLSDNSIYVSRNGVDVPFASAYPAADPYYVKGATWYVASRPLILKLNPADDMGGDVDDELDDAAENMPPNRMEFVNFGATQPLPMGEVLYIGSIDGTPLYATRSDIGGLLPDLEAKLRVSTDLDDILDDEEFATRFGTEIDTFYTVVEPSLVQTGRGCVFQPMSSTRVIRRTRG